jgi:hypothetical protein
MILNNIAGWVEVGGQRFYAKSKAEYRFACYLEWLRINDNISRWEYEPREFWFEPIKRGCVSYKPDFCTYEEIGQDPCSGFIEFKQTWYEVKGYMDAKSKTKIARFRKYFPKEILIVIDSKWFSRNGKKLKGLVPGWD